MIKDIHFDPLYGAVTFRAERLGLTDFWSSPQPFAQPTHAGELAKRLNSVLQSHEFDRLNHLKQAGFSWLVYPSATHTRYAHSLGCWYLGEQALDSIRVVPEVFGSESLGSTDRVFLIDWLRTSDLQEEFMLSLLLHDVGHFPFSHVFEESLDYSDIRHEDVGVQYILGSGPVYDSFRRRTDRAAEALGSEGGAYLCEVLDSMSPAILNKGIVCYLIGGDEHHISSESPTVQVKSRSLRQLISGVIDLDRVDHYHRDAFSMGLRIGYLNPIALLVGMELCSDSSKGECWIRLSDTSAMQALALLNTRDMLLRYVFDNPSNAAYSTMLIWAVHLVLLERPEIKLDILAMTDYELLGFLLNNNCSGAASKLAARLLHSAPYTRAGRFQIVNPQYRDHERLEEVREEIIQHLSASGHGPSDEDVLIRYSRDLTRRRPVKTAWKEWMDMDRLQNLDGTTLSTLDMYSKQIEYLAKQFEEHDGAIQVFAANPSMASDARTLLSDKGFLKPVGD